MADQVQEIKSKIDIIDLIGEYVQLKKAGRNFRGLCPFHNEKSPSFMVNPEMQMFKCFGCGESGDIFTFLQKHEGLEFYEALQILGKKAGVEIKSNYDPDSNLKKEVKNANYEAARFYHYVLTKHENGKKALKYLQEERRLTLETIENFKLGFAPEEPSIVSKYLKNKKGIDEKIIETAGIAYRGKYGLVDRFRGRIIFPISDHRSNIIALAGRILPELSGKGLAKYINSPETPIYHKSSSLYGIDMAKQHIKKSQSVVLTEGELDMLSSWQAGVKNVVAIKGTALTKEQIFLLSRFTEKVVLALDADFAGNNAALRGITLAQNQGMEIKVASMADYKDPDEFVQSNPEEYKKAIKNAQDVWDFLIDLSAKTYDLSTGSGKSKAAKFYLPFLKSLDDEVLKSHYLAEFSRKIDVKSNLLRKQIVNNQTKEKPKENQKKESSIKKTRRQMLEESVVRIGLTNSYDKIEKLVGLDVLSDKKLKRLVQLALKVKDFDLKSFASKVPSEIKEVLRNLLFTEFEGEESDKDFDEALSALRLMDAKEKLSDLSLKMNKYESENNQEMLKIVQKKFRKCTQVIARLEDYKNNSII